jgi:hypothetical protein
MAYKNDHEMVIAGKYGKASSDAKAELFETYDRLRDLTVAGPAIAGNGLGAFSSMFLNFARLFSPSSFIPVLGSSAVSVPGTSFFSPISGGTAVTPGGSAAFGLGSLGRYPSFPNLSGKAAPLSIGLGIGSMLLGSAFGLGSMSGAGNYAIGGGPTGFAAGAVAGGTAAGVAAGAGFGRGFVLPLAGIVSGLGGLATSLGPFFGPFGIAAMAGGSIASGVAGAVLRSYQTIGNRVLTNADVILTNKIKNIETTVKQLDTQSGIIRKMIKESVEGDSKALQELL